MSDIGPIGRANAASFDRSHQVSRQPSVSQDTPRGSDQVELSRTAQLLSKLAELPDVRQDLVDRVRAEIDAGTYETPEKIDAAIDAMAYEFS